MTATGCGGGGGSETTPPPPPPAKLSVQGGKVIDGYVSGATVWLDINGNHLKDADEPSTVSKAAGAYQLELSEPQRACLPYSTLYVDVPVGAVDEDSGPVKEAYQMAIAPQFQPISVDQVLNISPLTTAIWDQVRTRITASDPKLSSCEQLRQNQSLRETMIHEIKTVMGDLVRRHNLSEARIHDDFIKSKDEQSYKLAQDIVKGLKAGYAYKRQLHAQYPDATFIRAEVYRGRGTRQFDDQAGVWYRNASVWRPSGYLNEWVVLDENLSKIQRVLNLRRQDSQPWGAATLKTTRTAYNFQNDGSDYLCKLNEAVEQSKDGVRYELVVHYEDPKREADPQACFNAAHAASPGPVGLREYYTDYRVGQVSYLSNLRFYAEQPEHALLKDWERLQGKSAQLDFASVIQRMAASGYRFEDEVKLPVFSWLKRSTDDSQLRITIEKSNTGPWTRTSTLADGTSRKECSADQGKTWGGSCGG
ncbi:hypothetical protein C1O66_13570 [Paucibacter aquatile]|uniref:Uncharacterized protein n=1 Tax=Kinneretia aquatilis TaxID=2070761 RepID=A0A2N8KYB5_9BURK|nr:hypothetical protein C1O66_13570 [Paucibacter aquatile]